MRVTILVSAAGSTNGVNVIKALRSQNAYDVRIIGIDSDIYAAGLHLADEHEIVPKVSEPGFKDRLLQICKEYNVNMLIPTHSVELSFYSSNQKSLEEIAVRMMVPSVKSLETCDDKVKIANFFHEFNVKCPREYDLTDIKSIPGNHFPLFIKSRFGSGSSYARKISNYDELNFYLERTPTPIIQEYIEGVEYTINVISDFEGRVVGALPIKRLRVRGGLAIVAETELNLRLIQETKRIVEALHLVGSSNVQVIVRNKEQIFIEVNPRFASGSLPLAVASGLNIPLIMVKLMLGELIPKLSLQNGKKMIRYWDFIIVDKAQDKL